MELQPHQQRVINEKRELDEKIEKLGVFKRTPVFEALPWKEQELLSTQAYIMMLYSAILGKRIAGYQ